MPPALIQISKNPTNKKIIFDDDGDVVETVTTNSTKSEKKAKKKKFKDTEADELKTEQLEIKEDEDEEEDYFAKREKRMQRMLEQQNNEKDDDESQKKWYHIYPQLTQGEDVLDMKDSDQMELYNLCKSSFEAEMPTFNKRNPSDARWLQTALYKGTAKDRANAGALLVTSNPVGNLEALGTLIGCTKLSNKSSNDVITILTDLWKEVLLPPHRKLLTIQMRGADWKLVRKDTMLKKEQQKRIYAYWYFEHELKEHYFEFLKNLQQGIQTGQENNKNNAIVAAAQLLSYAPEKEQMLLTMIINKLGDPIAKIASKALHHLSEVAHKHPNMCGVIVSETEKLIFRNNISERAQHFALCFLSSIAPAGRPEVCTKLVHICFSLFKVLVQKGAVNNRTMQAILRCLQKAILEAKPVDGSTELLSKDMQDTVYRLVHLADIRISVQTLGLLLQLITIKTDKSDRFYNALYKKLLDIEVTTLGMKTAAQLLHIVHRAIHIDNHVARAQAFIKRLLQVALYTPAHMAAGCLIVINKLLRSRKELLPGLGLLGQPTGNSISKVRADDEELAKFDSDGEEKYEDIQEDTLNGSTKSINEQLTDDEQLKTEDNEQLSKASSWHHAKVNMHTTDSKVKEIGASKYDPYHRVPAFAGAEFALHVELLLLREHFHPTVQVFADNILKQKRIDYYGDPLRDFGLPTFLERFAFKNPKKLDKQSAETPSLAHKRYVAFGTRGKSVKALTKVNCTEDEMYIFNFLEQKRQRAVVNKTKEKSNSDDEEENDGLKPGEVNDDEFDTYLDSFFGKKAKAAADDEAELDFLKELGGEIKAETKQKKKQKRVTADDDDVEDIDADWGDDDDNNEAEFDNDGADISDDEEGSIDLSENDDDDDDDGGSISLDDNEDDDNDSKDMSDMSDDSADEDEDDANDNDLMPSKSKKPRKQESIMNGKSFAKQLKHSNDMSSLFAAADDFAELLEETGKTKGQGTSNVIFNKDKSTEKQMKWETKRHSNAKTYTKKRKTSAAGGKRFAKKHKH